MAGVSRRSAPGAERGERLASIARESPDRRTPVTAPASGRRCRSRPRGRLGGRHRGDPGSRHIAGRGGGRRPSDRRGRRDNRRRSARRRGWGGACGRTRARRADRGGAMSGQDDRQRDRGPGNGGRSRTEYRARPKARFLHAGVDRALELAQLYSPLTYDIARYRGMRQFGGRGRRTAGPGPAQPGYSARSSIIGEVGRLVPPAGSTVRAR